MKTSIETAEHIGWGEKCSAWWLHRSDKFTLVQERMPAGTSEKTHFHQAVDQFFYCLEGLLCINLKTIHYELYPHEGLFVPAGEIHKIHNSSAKEVKFLVISSSDSSQDRVDCE